MFHKKTVFLLLFLLTFTISEASAIEYRLPLNTSIPSDMKVNFDNYYINASGVSITITSWFINNWLNYSVSGSGIQEIYNGTKPDAVYIDGSRKAENDGWTYFSGKITVSSASSNVAVSFTSVLYDASFLLAMLAFILAFIAIGIASLK